MANKGELNMKLPKGLKQFHKVSDRHVLTIETDMNLSEIRVVEYLSDRLRRAGNCLTWIMLKRYKQLMRTKKYRKVLVLYGKTKDKKYSDQLKEMQAVYRITWEDCRKEMIPIAYRYGLKAVFAMTRAEDVWSGIERCLYGNGKTLHFLKEGELPVIRAKQIDRAIIMLVEDSKLRFKLDNINFGVRVKDRFHQDTINAVLNYIENSEKIDNEVVRQYKLTGTCASTFRPCYASLVHKTIRGKRRVYLHLTLEGKALPKYDKKGNLRHSLGTGVVGADIGTQTVAYTSDNEVGLKNLAERGQSILKSERKERSLHRAMDRSLRANNPDNYNTDDTVKKGKKQWVKSRNYYKLQYQYRELCRKNAINRRIAINEDANHLRNLGDIFITEPKNASKLMRRAKETTKNSKGKYNRKKRFGKSIKNRCPGGFQAAVQKKFEHMGGKYIEVPNDYRASQYDHTLDDYVKKKLSERMFSLYDGTKVQRDWYSSFLLYCYNYLTNQIDKEKCNKEFGRMYEMEKKLIDQIIENKTAILNSGIKVA